MLYITKPKYRDVVLIPNPFFFFFPVWRNVLSFRLSTSDRKDLHVFLLTGVLDVKKKTKNRKKAAVQTLRLMFHRGIIIIIIWE